MSAIRSQLYALVYIEVVLDAIRSELCSSETEEKKNRVRDCLDAIHSTLQMYDVASIRVDSAMKKMEDVLRKLNPETMETLDFVCSCMWLISEMKDQAPKAKKELWENLEEAFFELYKIADPELECEKAIRHGSAIGQGLKEVVFNG